MGRRGRHIYFCYIDIPPSSLYFYTQFNDQSPYMLASRFIPRIFCVTQRFLNFELNKEGFLFELRREALCTMNTDPRTLLSLLLKWLLRMTSI